jgi:hypothetical protein
MSKSAFCYLFFSGLSVLAVILIVVLKLFGKITWTWLSLEWILIASSLIIPIAVVGFLKVSDFGKSD